MHARGRQCNNGAVLFVKIATQRLVAKLGAMTLMHWLLLMVCVLALLPDMPQGIISHPWFSAAGTWGPVAVTTVAAVILGNKFGRRKRTLTGARYRWYRALRFTLGLTVMLNQVVALMVFDWGNVVRERYHLGDWWLVDELCLIAPLVVGLCSFWWGIYPAEKALHKSSDPPDSVTFWSRRDYVLFQMRVHLGLMLLPMLLYVSVQDLATRLSPGLLQLPGQLSWWWLAVSVISTAGTLAILPWVLVRVWGTRSLPAGPVRDLLQVTARRLGFRCTDLRVWHTRHNVANAMVTGILPWPRYIILSDALIEGLSPEELVAVLGHEIGHVRRCHMLLYVLVMTLALFSGGLLLQRYTPDLQVNWVTMTLHFTDNKHWRHWLQLLFSLTAIGVYVWLLFGFISRRCEREADVYGCLAASCNQPVCLGFHIGTFFLDEKPSHLCPTGIQTFIRALEKVADLNGIPKNQWTWRHGSIAQRIAYLQRLITAAPRSVALPRYSWIPQWGLLGLLAGISLLLCL